MPYAAPHRILFIDAYDSFSNNIVSLLETRLHVEVFKIKIHDEILDFPGFLTSFTAVVAGPGPGDPGKSSDVGWIQALWKLEKDEEVPVLGVCLGFQSLVLGFGGSVERLSEPRHGIVRKVRSNGRSIFSGVDNVRTVQYHSLHATLGHDFGFTPEDTANAVFHFRPTSRCPDLLPLAWDYSIDNVPNTAAVSSAKDTAFVLMAVKHRIKPFWGVQFHAESISSNEDAQKVIINWWHAALRWMMESRKSNASLGISLYQSPSLQIPQYISPKVINNLGSLLQYFGYCGTTRKMQNHYVDSRHSDIIDCKPKKSRLATKTDVYDGPVTGARKQSSEVISRRINIGQLTVPKICTALELHDKDMVILDSEQHQRKEVGEFSIIGTVSPDSLKFQYNIGDPHIRQISGTKTKFISLGAYSGSFLAFLKAFLRQKQQVTNSNRSVPFWGGLMGYTSYEACLETLDVRGNLVKNAHVNHEKPDVSFVFVERSIVIDHISCNVYIQSIKPADHEWVSETSSLLETLDTPLKKTSLIPPFKTQTCLPDEELYKSQVRACQESIRAGDSYEICLTTEATIKTSISLSTWDLYQCLRSINPAPFAAYLRLGNLTLLSSSPERFLRWTRPSRKRNNKANDEDEDNNKTSICQFRPIKGTVKRQPDPEQPPLTLAEATALLSTPKERAENLMIVDLIRHDLHGVVGSGNVTVPKLMVVEEYATLFQLVSVIEGVLSVDSSNAIEETKNKNDADTHHNSPNQEPTHITPPRKENPTGIDVLSASLPPGSMTGAPKLRSCQLIQALEQRNRGIYSGVVGYMDVGGGGDFSVVIRSAVRWDTCHSPDTGQEDHDDELDDLNDVESSSATSDTRTQAQEEGEGDTWTIGAGGAVTALSTEDGEWEEMMAKLRSTLRLFEIGD